MPSAALSWTQPTAGNRAIEFYQIANQCGAIELRINLLDLNGRELPFWSSIVGDARRRGYSGEAIFPAARYNVRLRLLEPEFAADCDIDLAITANADADVSKPNSADTRPFDSLSSNLSGIEQWRSEVMLAFARKGLGDLISLQTIKISDFYGNFGHDENDVNSIALREFTSYCAWRKSDRSASPSYDDDKRVIFDWMIEKMVREKLNIGYRAYDNIDTLCINNIVTIPEIAKFMASKDFRRYVIHFWNYEEHTELDHIGMLFEVSRIMGVSYNQIIIKIDDYPSCSPIYYTLPDDISVGRSCLDGAFSSGRLKIDRQVPEKAEAKRGKVALALVTPARIQRAFDKLAGKAIKFDILYNDGRIIRLRTAPVRGLVLADARQWELLTLTIMLGEPGTMSGLVRGEEPSEPLSILTEGWTAAGLGSRAPSEASFYAGPSMDGAHFRELQRFTDSFLERISSP